MDNKIFFVSLGCSRNLVDTEVMLGRVMERGYVVVQEAAEADFLVINTCGFLQEARAEAYNVIEELFEEKRAGAKVVVAGCMVKKEKGALKEAFPEIHYFLGSGDVGKIIDALESTEQGEAVSKERSYLQEPGQARVVSTGGTYAYLKIAEGCAKRCSFCVIPKIKGPLKSKSVEQVVAEFKELLDQGIFEVVLIAQDLGDYGKDRGEKGGLERLLKELLKETRPFWLRLLYLYPDEITDELIALMKSDERVCRYLDMPMQHVNDALLKAMRRKTSRKEIESVLGALRAELPGVVVRTSLMVGFPTESEAQFEELLAFVKEGNLDAVGVFEYSQEEDALSYKMGGQVSDAVKGERRRRLMEAQQACVRSRGAAYVGRQMDVLVDGYHPESELLLVGRHQGQCPEVDGCVILNDWERVTEFGKRYRVEITEVSAYDLVGKVVSDV